MRRHIEEIEIKEPPLQELNKKRSCVKRSCLTGCGCIAVFILASVLILYIAANPRQKELKEVPAHFPANIPVYDKDAIHSITLVSGRERSRWIEAAAYVPKIILSPLLIATERNGVASSTEQTSWKHLVNVIEEPISDHRDLITVSWSELGAQPKFINTYYQTELKKQGYTVTVPEQTSDTIRMFEFSKDAVNGYLLITDDPADDGTDQLLLSVRIPTP